MCICWGCGVGMGGKCLTECWVGDSDSLLVPGKKRERPELFAATREAKCMPAGESADDLKRDTFMLLWFALVSHTTSCAQHQHHDQRQLQRQHVRKCACA